MTQIYTDADNNIVVAGSPLVDYVPQYIEAVSGYARTIKDRKIILFRAITLDEFKQLDSFSFRGQLWFLSPRNNCAYHCCLNSKVKLWKTRPNDADCAFKYGLYEHFHVTWKNGKQVAGPILMVEV